jgi:hypothetical protein
VPLERPVRNHPARTGPTVQLTALDQTLLWAPSASCTGHDDTCPRKAGSSPDPKRGLEVMALGAAARPSEIAP